MLRATGTSGVLRVGYQWAADLGAWIIEPQGMPAVFVLRTNVERRHDYWYEQEPIDLALAFGTTEWVWRGVTVNRLTVNEISVALVERPVVAERLSEKAPIAVQAGAWGHRRSRGIG